MNKRTRTCAHTLFSHSSFERTPCRVYIYMVGRNHPFCRARKLSIVCLRGPPGRPARCRDEKETIANIVSGKHVYTITPMYLRASREHELARSRQVLVAKGGEARDSLGRERACTGRCFRRTMRNKISRLCRTHLPIGRSRPRESFRGFAGYLCSSSLF